MDRDQALPSPDQDEARRLELQAALRELAPKAWYRRPANDKMTYPCFLYRPSRPYVLHANNRLYVMKACWNVIYISEEPDMGIVRRMLEAFEWIQFDREYESDDLYHYSFTLYF